MTQGVQYSSANDTALLLDVVQPNPLPAHPAPVVVYIHGGGWRSGERRDGYGLLTTLARAGYVGFTIDYRLSGQSPYPAQIHDCKAAIRWVRLHAGEYGGDPSRIGVVGLSAGAHLAALLGTTDGVTELEGDLPPVGASSAVQAVCDMFGPADLRSSAGAATNPASFVQQLLGGAPESQPELARRASPVVFTDADDPPFLIIHGTADSTVPIEQSRRLRDALHATGVQVELIEVPGGGHGDFQHTSPNWTQLQQRIVAFFDTHLR